MNLKTRIDKLLAKQALTPQAGPWQLPVCEYDPNTPGDRERVAAEIRVAALDAGWTEKDGPYVILLPTNGRAAETE
jgi:hypothetical protein